MARYIDVEPLEEKLKEHIKKTESELMLGALSTFLRVLDITPTADVAPVRHGRFVPFEDVFMDTCWECSECGLEFYLADGGTPKENRYNYCPNCGAKMDGESDE